MKYYWISRFILALLAIGILVSCSKRVRSNDPDKSLSADAKIQKHRVTITLLATRSYCGGAEPPEGMLLDLRTPKPESGKWLYIRTGNTNLLDVVILDSAQTDANGRASFLLPEGNYCLVFDNKKDHVQYDKFWRAYANGDENYSPIDRRCLDDWLKRPEKVFTVVKDSENQVALQIHIACSWDMVPCSIYSGPLPP